MSKASRASRVELQTVRSSAKLTFYVDYHIGNTEISATWLYLICSLCVAMEDSDCEPCFLTNELSFEPNFGCAQSFTMSALRQGLVLSRSKSRRWLIGIFLFLHILCVSGQHNECHKFAASSTIQLTDTNTRQLLGLQIRQNIAVC